MIGHEAKGVEVNQERPRTALQGVAFNIIGRRKKTGGRLYPLLVVKLEKIVHKTEVILVVKKNIPLFNPSVYNMVHFHIGSIRHAMSYGYCYDIACRIYYEIVLTTRYNQYRPALTGRSHRPP